MDIQNLTFNKINSIEVHSTETQSTPYESRKITGISPQGDWDGWLLGYEISLSDGSVWFAERGPIDQWDWEVGDEIRIELSNDSANCRITNINRNESVEFRKTFDWKEFSH